MTNCDNLRSDEEGSKVSSISLFQRRDSRIRVGFPYNVNVVSGDYWFEFIENRA